MMQDAGVEGEEVHLAVWTTTPWTLPGNVVSYSYFPCPH